MKQLVQITLPKQIADDLTTYLEAARYGLQWPIILSDMDISDEEAERLRKPLEKYLNRED